MADVATNVRLTADAASRNGSVIVGAPKGAKTDAIGTNYRIRAGGEAATATVTFTGDPSDGETIVIIDADGVSKTYTAENDGETAASRLFNSGGTAAQAATSLKVCIDHANGHNGSIAVADDGAGVLTLTQMKPGIRGNTTITEGLTDATKTDFSGGTSEAGVNDASLVTGLDTKWTARFDDKTYYTS